MSQTHTGQWSSRFKLTSGLGTGDAVVERDWLAVKSLTELGVHSLGLVLLRVRFSGLKLLKQVQLVSTGRSRVGRPDRDLSSIRSLRRLG